jgi:hypothetical protein
MNPNTHLIAEALAGFDLDDVQAWVNMQRGADALEQDPDAFVEEIAEVAGPGQWSEAEIQKAQTIMGAIVGFTAYTQNMKVGDDIDPERERLIAWAVQELVRYGPRTRCATCFRG